MYVYICIYICTYICVYTALPLSGCRTVVKLTWHDMTCCVCVVNPSGKEPGVSNWVFRLN